MHFLKENTYLFHLTESMYETNAITPKKMKLTLPKTANVKLLIKQMHNRIAIIFFFIIVQTCQLFFQS
jgi:hypothetical protein